jgi:hypothetical protein
VDRKHDRPPSDRTPVEPPRPTEPPTQRKRFRIQKIEERIAPKKHSSSTYETYSGGIY